MLPPKKLQEFGNNFGKWLFVKDLQLNHSPQRREDRRDAKITARPRSHGFDKLNPSDIYTN
jgi:hypothetical protein